MMKLISKMQPMGRALMLPIAVLPVAALLLRLGQDDLLNVPAIAAAGGAIFENLGLLFAIGVAVGLAKENHGAAGLAAVVGYLIATQGAKVLIDVPVDLGADLPKDAKAALVQGFLNGELKKLSVPVGLLSGLFAGWAFNRFGDIRLPAYLAFFGGRRFVPIVCGFAGVFLALLFGYFWQPIEHGMDLLSKAVLASQEFGLFIYGVLNRLLIVTGLHHIINNIAWFQLGEYGGATGDLGRFFKGDASAGAFMSGFFPVMMFGLPGACLAMYQTAMPEKRRAVGGLLISMALTSFLTGVTEPIEFTFMFLAPVLFAVHALLTGAAMVLMNVLNVKLGFGFSAGLFDYVLNFSLSTNPLLLIPVGAGYFALYFVLFRWFILRFDLKVLGRERDDVGALPAEVGKGGETALSWISALGGAINLRTVEACTTRLRLTVADPARINEAGLKPLGSRGVLKLGDGAVQVVVGPIADQLAAEIRAALRGGGAPPASVESAPIAVRAPTQNADLAPSPPSADLQALLAAFGGSTNILRAQAFASRLVVEVRNAASVDAAGLAASRFRGAQRVGDQTWHVLVGPGAPAAAAALKGLTPHS